MLRYYQISREISKAEYERETGEETNEDEIVPIEQPKLKIGEILMLLLATVWHTLMAYG
jgi:hypothetical protein